MLWNSFSSIAESQKIVYGQKICWSKILIFLKNQIRIFKKFTVRDKESYNFLFVLPIRWIFYRYNFQLILLTIIIVALSQQWVIPLLRNSVEPFSTMKLDRCLERVLKLAVPNHVIWLICFYTIFHSALNLIAEILRFADRQFYLYVYLHFFKVLEFFNYIE